MQMTKTLRPILLGATILSLCIGGNTAAHGAEAATSKLGYFLPKTQIVVTGTVTYEVRNVLVRKSVTAQASEGDVTPVASLDDIKNLTNGSVIALADWTKVTGKKTLDMALLGLMLAEVKSCTKPLRVGSDLNFTARTVADTAAYMPLNLSGDFFNEVAADVTFAEDGRLLSFNGSSEGKVGTLLGSLASVVGKVVGLFSGAADGALAESTNLATSGNFQLSLRDTDDVTKLCQSPVIADQLADKYAAIFAPTGSEKARVAELSAAIKKQKVAQVKLLDSAIDQKGGYLNASFAVDDAERNTVPISKNTRVEKLKEITATHATSQQILAHLNAEVRTVKAAMKAKQDQFKKQAGLVAVRSTRPVSETYDIADIPFVCTDKKTSLCLDVARKVSGAGGAYPYLVEPDVQGLDGAKFKRIKGFAKYTGVMLVLSGVKTNDSGGPVVDTYGTVPDPGGKSKENWIYTRQPVVMDLQVLESTGLPKSVDTRDGSVTLTNYLVPKKSFLLTVTDSRTPMVGQKLSKTAFSKRELNIETHANGALKSVKAKSTAGAAELATVLDALVDNSIAGIKSGKQAVLDIAALNSQLDLSAGAAELAELQQQKSLVDARLAADGAEASAALLKEQTLLDAQIALAAKQAAGEQATVQSELALLKARAELAAARSGDTVEEAIRKEIELIKLQKELEAAKLPPSAPTQADELRDQIKLLQLRLQLLEARKTLDEARDD